MFSGCLTALVTPFKKYQVDAKKFRELIEWQIAHQADGIVLCGTTGEAATLSDEEKVRIFKEAVRTVRGRIPVIAGTGSNDTAKTIKLTQRAKKCRVDAALVVTPYYNKPTQAGLYLHYKAIAQKSRCPIIVYNVPGRTAVSIDPKTVARLARLKNIVAIKEACGKLSQIRQIKKLCRLPILSGEDAQTIPIMKAGGVGVISVVSNLIAQDMSAMVQAFSQGNRKLAAAWERKINPLSNAMFFETNPIPLKTALKMLDRLNGELRLPLCPMQPDTKQKLKQALKKYGLRLDSSYAI
ncbi:MAG: 4-hydroxy-tetrahydrodipicolinate synthase [Planctomycetes bacterium]|nr:4-hydroxy-tetrahydrodipicolinate synthase [Planctomycetota bacterium]